MLVRLARWATVMTRWVLLSIGLGLITVGMVQIGRVDNVPLAEVWPPVMVIAGVSCLITAVSPTFLWPRIFAGAAIFSSSCLRGIVLLHDITWGRFRDLSIDQKLPTLGGIAFYLLILCPLVLHYWITTVIPWGVRKDVRSV